MSRKVLFVLFIVVAALAIWKRNEILDFFLGNKKTVNQTEVKLLLENDYSIDSLAAILLEKGIIAKKSVFIDEAKNQGLLDDSFDAGKYVILSGTRISDLVEGFSKDENGQGKSEVKVNVLFNRCVTIEDIGMNVSKCIQADSASIVDLIYNQKTLAKYQFNQAQIPALFLPDSYEMYYDTDAEGFIAFMAEKFKEFWNNDRLEKMKSIGFEYPSQVVTLASIVYSEQSKVASEWPIIAKLYINRLNDGMKLQSDPTFKFCWEGKLNGVNRLLAKHRNIDCVYNTYKYAGLPPGPICITPAKVVDAVLSPANVDYLFMCAKPDYSGEHDFTSSGVQHVKNAGIYQKWLSAEQLR